MKNYRDWGIPLGRRFRALKLWFLLQDQGVEGLQRRLRRDIANAQWLKAALDITPKWQRLAPVHLQTLCLRHCPVNLTREADLARHNLAIAEAVNQSGKAYVTPSVLRGVQMFRVSIGGELTELEHVKALWTTLQAVAKSAQS